MHQYPNLLPTDSDNAARPRRREWLRVRMWAGSRVPAFKRGEVLLMQRIDQMAMLATPDKKFEKDYRLGLQPKYFKATKELFPGAVMPRRRKLLLLA